MTDPLDPMPITNKSMVNTHKSISAHTQSLLRYRQHLLNQHNEREGARHPAAPIAQAIFGGQAQKLLRDSERGCVSKLGGVAVAAKNELTKGQR